ncbi:unnamed protein product [Caenorhabditis sp. 36 PRJEB53466]|nr:unnamed protein product [Caenorhabditis sp. 36 PRJEB53466]
MDGYEEEEEEIQVKYRLRGESEWIVKKEAVMTLDKTQWAIRLKLNKQGEGQQYYSLHVALLTPGITARTHIKCHREGQDSSDWDQEYTFGAHQSVLVNPCLMKTDNKEKVTFVVVLQLMWSKPIPFELTKELVWPKGDFTLKADGRTLKVDHEYLKRRAPLLAYMFEDDEKCEYEVKDVKFEDLVDALGALQHRWEFAADRLVELIRSRADSASISGESRWTANETAERLDFETPFTWTIEEFSTLKSSTSSPNQHVLLASDDGVHKCILYVYVQQFSGTKYVSFGIQMNTFEDVDENEDSNMFAEREEDDDDEFFDVYINAISESGDRVIRDQIHRIQVNNSVIVGSPVFAKLDDVLPWVSADDKLTIEFGWTQNLGEVKPGGTYVLPGTVDAKIVCDDTTLRINKEYLCHHSDYFSGLFSDRWGSRDSVKLPAEKLKVLSVALEMLYNRRVSMSPVLLSQVLDCADRTWMSQLTEGIQRMLWSSQMEIEDREWLAEQFQLKDLEVKCTLEHKKEQLKLKKVSRKRARPADFKDEPPMAPPQPGRPSHDQEMEDSAPMLQQEAPQLPEQVSS